MDLFSVLLSVHIYSSLGAVGVGDLLFVCNLTFRASVG